jgi:hypothetical protein
MKNDNELITIEFHSRAKEIFYSLLNSFLDSAAKLDRKHSEYQFRQLKDQYVHTLKQQLEYMARELMETHQHSQRMPELEQSISYQVKEYLHLFNRETAR